MDKTTTGERLRQIINERGLKQVDILRKCEPFSQKYGVHIRKNELSQYINKGVEPKQRKLTILALALNVNEAWLMGFDVPRDRQRTNTEKDLLIQKVQAEFGFIMPELIKLLPKLDKADQLRLLERAEILLEDEKYHQKSGNGSA